MPQKKKSVKSANEAANANVVDDYSYVYQYVVKSMRKHSSLFVDKIQNKGAFSLYERHLWFSCCAMKR